jgi:hypothetical protein
MVDKFDSSGNILFQQILTTFGGASNISITPTSDGGYASAGCAMATLSQPCSGLVMKLSSTGSPQLGETFSETAQSFSGAVASGNGGLAFNTITPTADGGYVVSGVADIQVSSGFGEALAVLKLTAAGTVQWSHVYFSSVWGSFGSGTSRYPVFATADGGYTVSGIAKQLAYPFQHVLLLLHLDSAGNVVWQRGYGLSNSNGDVANAISAIMTSDGGYLMGGTSNVFISGDEYDGILVKTDSQGNIQWQRFYSATEPSGSNVVQIQDVIQTPGGYAAAGYSYAGSASYGGPAFFVLQTDPQGQVGTCACSQPADLADQVLDLQAQNAVFASTNVALTFVPQSLNVRSTSVRPITPPSVLMEKLPSRLLSARYTTLGSRGSTARVRV